MDLKRIKFSTDTEWRGSGGWSFSNTLAKYLSKAGWPIVDSLQDADIFLITGPTTANRDVVKMAIDKGIKVVFRVDNIPEDYRNRGTAVSRLKDFSKMADVVVYQSNWAKDYVMGLTEVDGAVIYNGVDTKTFFSRKNKKNKEIVNYLYVKSSTNENKRWPEAKYYFRMEWLKNKNSKLHLVGRWGREIKEYNFGLFNEPYEYHGEIKNPYQMAELYRQCDIILIPYYNDACSQVVLEAKASGLQINTCFSGMTGGTPELLELSDISAERMTQEYIGLFNLVMQ